MADATTDDDIYVPRYPIDPNTHAIDTMAKHALKIGASLNLLIRRWPVDMSNPVAVATLVEELDRYIAKRIAEGADPASLEIDLPTDDGVHYFGYVRTDAGHSVPFLLPGGMVNAFVLGLAIRDDRLTAYQLAFGPGALPVYEKSLIPT